MVIQDDFTIDVVDRKITMDTAFANDRPVDVYTVNELYSFLQDTFDEPGFMQHSIPMSAQTPTQYTLINGWFMDNNSMKALYGGAIQTSGWTYVASPAAGITQLRWEDGSADAPVAGDIGVTLTGGTSTATGVLLAVDAFSPIRQVCWVRNTNGSQFQDNENVTGTGVVLDTEVTNGFQNGETVWANLFSVGSKTATTEIYIGQEDDYQGGRAYQLPDASDRLRRKIEKVDEWWDTDRDFATGSPNLLGGVDHFDVLLKTTEAGVLIDSGNLWVGARQFGTVYSHFELVAAASGNFVVPFASTGADLNSADGPYNVLFDGRTGTTMAVGDILINVAHGTGSNEPLNRLRAVVTAVTGGASASGNFDFYLIGENEAKATTDRTLKQFIDNDDLGTLGASTNDFDISGSVSQVSAGPADAQGVTITFANAQRDVDEDTTDEEYACVIDCNNIALQDVYQYTQFLCSRGNQDGEVADSQDVLLPAAPLGADGYETSEFYRAVGDITVPWDSRVGTAPAEGDLVTNAAVSWTASGVVVALSDPAGASGQLTLTQVKGIWVTADAVAQPVQHGINEVRVNGTPSSITDNTGAPFGTFAGGKWFVARGVVLDNVPSADANNWETSELDGTRRAPPTSRSITFGGLVANDRAGLFEVATAGEDDIVKTHNTWSSGGGLSDVNFTVSGGIDLDVPLDGWVRHVDDDSSVGAEYRYEYLSFVISTGVVTLRAVSGGTDDGGGSATVISLTGIGTSFGTDGFSKVGHEVRATTGEFATILRAIDANNLETTVLSGAASWAGKVFEINQVVVAMAASDTYYFPFIDDTALGTTLTTTIKYVGDTDLIARARFSDPDVGGTKILPFQQKNITLEDANLTVTAIRTDDTIVS